MNDLPPLLLLLTVTVLPAAVLAGSSLYPIRRYADRFGLVARPGGHSSHRHVTPLGGGLGIYVGVVGTLSAGALVVVAAGDQSGWIPDGLASMAAGASHRLTPLAGLLIAATTLTVLGYLDDARNLPPGWRLMVEFWVASFTVFGLGFELTAYIGSPWITRPLSVLWIVGIINSINMLDNMDGLAAGVAAIIAASMAAVMWRTPDAQTASPQFLVAGLLMVVSGACVGFLWHNRPPARIFMGDAGSYLVGYLIAVGMLMATFAGGGLLDPRPHAVLAPLCAMAVPLYDTATVVGIRIREGRPIHRGDHSHFSHRLVALGLSRTAAVVTIYLVTATCGLAAVLLTTVPLTEAVMVIGIVVCMLALIAVLESTSWNLRPRRPDGPPDAATDDER